MEQKIDMTQVPPDYNDNRVLDGLSLDGNQKKTGFIKFLIFTAIAIMVFFIPLTINGETDITFGIIYNFLKNTMGIFGLWLACLIITMNAVLCTFTKISTNKTGKYSKLHDYYEGDTIVHNILYIAGAVFIILYTLDYTLKGFNAPSWLLNNGIGNTVISAIVIDVMCIITVGSFFMPFLLNYGIVDLFGALMEPIMRPVFKVPGRAAVNAIASFVSSSSVGVLITNRLYREQVYTKREACIIATGFSAVSVGFAYMVIKTAGLQNQFLLIYFISMLITLVVTGIVGRFSPLRKKPDVYLDGRVQSKEDIEKEKPSTGDGLLKTGYNRAIKKAYVAPNIFTEIYKGLKDGFTVLPKVISLLTAVGIIGLMLAHYTPLFDWIGMVFQPLLNLLRVPDANLIAKSFPVGIAEMFLPVLLIADKVDIISEGARFMVVVVSMVQIIFFSETAVVMLATKMPLSVKDLFIIFIQRTIIAIIIAAPIMHLIY